MRDITAQDIGKQVKTSTGLTGLIVGHYADQYHYLPVSVQFGKEFVHFCLDGAPNDSAFVQRTYGHITEVF